MTKINRHDLELVAANEVRDRSGKVRDGCAPAERGEDLIQRYRDVPNRLMILYSSEDEIIGQYLKDHWAALDGMSGEICDIYPSLLQLDDGEDIYSFRCEISNIPGSEQVALDRLPMALFWSDYAYLVISLQKYTESKETLRSFFRAIFAFLDEIGRGLKPEDDDHVSAILGKITTVSNSSSTRTVVHVHRRITVNHKEINADRGSVVISDSVNTGDVSSSYSVFGSEIDISALAGELDLLRQELRKQSDGSLDQDRDVGNVAAAQAAAKKGDTSETMKYLGMASKWVLDIAKSVGVKVVTKALQDQMSGG